MRPKSMATVVVRFCSTPSISSVSMPAKLSGSSVCSGLISLTEPIIVVLPTPKPPEISTLMPSGIGLESPSWCSEIAEAMQHRLEDVVVEVLRATRRVVHRDQAVLHQVAEEHTNHAQREVH